MVVAAASAAYALAPRSVKTSSNPFIGASAVAADYTDINAEATIVTAAPNFSHPDASGSEKVLSAFFILLIDATN